MKSKMVKCNTCGADIASSAKVCPGCGAKQKKPIYKRWWLWVLVVIIVIGFANSCESDNTVQAAAPSQTEPEPVTYTPYTVMELVDELRDNALKAEQTHQGQYVEVTGRMDVIDSDGNYIGLYSGRDFELLCVQCYLKSDAQREVVMGLSKGDTVTVRGKITDIGEILGYQLNIDEFVTN